MFGMKQEKLLSELSLFTKEGGVTPNTAAPLRAGLLCRVGEACTPDVGVPLQLPPHRVLIAREACQRVFNTYQTLERNLLLEASLYNNPS